MLENETYSIVFTNKDLYNEHKNIIPEGTAVELWKPSMTIICVYETDETDKENQANTIKNVKIEDIRDRIIIGKDIFIDDIKEHLIERRKQSIEKCQKYIELIKELKLDSNSLAYNKEKDSIDYTNDKYQEMSEEEIKEKLVMIHFLEQQPDLDKYLSGEKIDEIKTRLTILDWIASTVGIIFPDCYDSSDCRYLSPDVPDEIWQNLAKLC